MRTESIFSGIPKGCSLAFDSKAAVSAGQIFDAAVLEARMGSILLEMLDGTHLNAVSENDISISEGEQLRLKVVGSENGKVIVKLIDRKAPEEKQKMLLSSMNLRNSKENRSIIESLLKAGMPVQKTMVKKIASFISRYGQKAVKASILLMSAGMKPEDSSVQKLTMIQQGGIRFNGFIRNIIGMVEAIPDKAFICNSARQIQLYDSVSEIVSDFCSQEGISDALPKTSISSLIRTVFFNLDNEQIPAKAVTVAGFNLKQHSLLNRLFIHVKERLNVESKVTDDSDGAYRRILTDSFQGFFQKSTAQNAKINNPMEDTYTELIDKIQILKNEVLPPLKFAESEDPVTLLDGIQNNIRFLRDLSGHIPYYQIPLKLNDYETAGELYILKRNNSKKDNDGISVLLSLDTQHIGRVDTLINIHGRTVMLNFMMENSNKASFAKTYRKEFEEAFCEMGYTLAGLRSTDGKKPGILDSEDYILKNGTYPAGVDYRI